MFLVGRTTPFLHAHETSWHSASRGTKSYKRPSLHLTVESTVQFIEPRPIKNSRPQCPLHRIPRGLKRSAAANSFERFFRATLCQATRGFVCVEPSCCGAIEEDLIRASHWSRKTGRPHRVLLPGGNTPVLHAHETSWHEVVRGFCLLTL